jgi:hypothetical protein
MNRRSRDKRQLGIVLSTLKSSVDELVVRLSSAARKDPEGGSIVQQLTIGKIDPENEFKKIRNAEMGKFAVKKNDLCPRTGGFKWALRCRARESNRSGNAILFHG